MKICPNWVLWYSSFPNHLNLCLIAQLYPTISTVTYLLSGGAPTWVLDTPGTKFEPVSKRKELMALFGPNPKEEDFIDDGSGRMWISEPEEGKHFAFDGRFLHGNALMNWAEEFYPRPKCPLS